MQTLNDIANYTPQNQIKLLNKAFNKRITNQIHSKTYKLKYDTYMNKNGTSDVKLNYKTEYNWKNELERVRRFVWWQCFRKNQDAINLSYCYITELPKEIGNLTNTTQLMLRTNELKKLPKEIGNLINLQKLYLNDNEFRKIPKEIKNLVNLERLDIDKNAITTFPKEAKNLFNLSRFDIDVKIFNKYTEKIKLNFILREILHYASHGNTFASLQHKRSIKIEN